MGLVEEIMKESLRKPLMIFQGTPDKMIENVLGLIEKDSIQKSSGTDDRSNHPELLLQSCSHSSWITCEDILGEPSIHDEFSRKFKLGKFLADSSYSVRTLEEDMGTESEGTPVSIVHNILGESLRAFQEKS